MKTYDELLSEYDEAEKELLDGLRRLKKACDDFVESDEIRHGAKYKYHNLRDKLNSAEMDIREMG